ncbi:hypothetical protein [Allosphingosinicella vermicomposti]|uniref:hypothetical protein n=1 Tax=Allosphingosinicella vermicomposti TaxID=614671 RepID=UPI00131A4F72|nr:hypothetical protein [Allosphingosinicella vermicomposti]
MLELPKAGAVEKAPSELRTFEDFGAAGDFEMHTGKGTDDTTAIQAALDWAHGDGALPSRAIMMTANNFLCGNITTHPVTTIIGTGRHTSAFICKAGTKGRWWSDRGGGAQKLMLSGIAWYGQEQGLTHICEFGSSRVQFGTEGILQGLWMRGAPQGQALSLDANVGIVRDVTVQDCRYGLKVIGNGNQLSNIVCMQAENVGVDLSGCFVRGLHVEATASAGLPMRFKGDCHAADVLISSSTGRSFGHLIEVDTKVYDEWSIENVQLLGSKYHIANGILKVGAHYRGGTDPDLFSGSSHIHALDISSGRLAIRHQEWQAFGLRIINQGGRLHHQIGSLTDCGIASAFVSKIEGASPRPVVSPVGGDDLTPFAGGGKVGNPKPSQFIFDTQVQVAADQAIQGTILHNSSGVALTAWLHIAPTMVNGVERSRLVAEFFNAVTGAAYPLTALPNGKTVTIGVSGFLA